MKTRIPKISNDRSSVSDNHAFGTTLSLTSASVRSQLRRVISAPRATAQYQNDAPPSLQIPQESEQGHELSPETESRIGRLSGGGQQLPSAVRNFFEARMGYDLGDVRVHADTHAAQTADNINARAYTLGNDIVFGPGEYAPQSESGKHLLAHELTHVVQQQNGVRRIQRTVKSALELIAEHRETIEEVANEWGVDPILVARVLFQENRNDGNIVRFEDYSNWNFTGISGPAIKNAGSYLGNPFGFNGSVGIGEMTVETARELINDYIPDREFSFYQPLPATYKGKDLGDRHINVLLSEHDDFAILMIVLYLKKIADSPLNQLSGDGSVGVSPETLLKDYNRGLPGHEKGVVSTVGKRSGPYQLEIIDAYSTGAVPEKPALKDDWVRPIIRLRNDTDSGQRVYLSFHSEIENESGWYNNNYAKYWDFAPGEEASISFEGETVRADMVKLLFATLDGAGGLTGNYSDPQQYWTGYTPDESGSFLIKIVPAK